MNENIFSNTEASVDLAQLNSFEAKVGKKLPDEFRTHYLKYNGGVPDRTYWVGAEIEEPLEVASFKPISDSPSNLLSTYLSMRDKQVIPENLLPFANDWGGNYFCLNVDSGLVSYFTTDNFYAELSFEENQKKSETVICSSFTNFVQGLVHEEDL
ncbi:MULTISPECIES: SMI1/KNR4 family protein [unclassified Pseudomonas]|uniref:SMI1/KNR4 family protein n=1 Tax=unclassified Pseudomonas TaxID=196821 RepID=UPI000ED32B3A|nr:MULTISPECIES: SMI1/KNR4 family protein [unclassified Pseudomonas]HBZ95236.1 SMI1/KNR4 family protein [Pseudomonas sp.]